MVNSNVLILAGFAVVLLGILMIFIGSIVQSSSGDQSNSGSDGSKTTVQTGGLIMIGPIPIIFGNNKGMIGFSVVFAIVLMVIYFILFYRGRIF